jgi:prepilin-type N-terminal cleavage/methylation domain-containing protein
MVIPAARRPIHESPITIHGRNLLLRGFRSASPINRDQLTINQPLRGFTLVELIVVIAIIIILAGMLFPAYRGVQNQAKKAQAKNDVTQIVTAVNAYYTEYGKYPLAVQGSDTVFSTTNSDIINTLRAVAAGANAGDALNPRKVVFFSPPDVKDNTSPRAGVASTGIYYDPWGKSADATKPEAGVYHIAIDGNYDNGLTNPYTADTGAGPTSLQLGVIAWSVGADGAQGTDYKAADDVISWQ